MKKEKMIKKIFILGLILGCTIQFSGCGSKENTENGQEAQDNKTESDFVYAAERQEFDISGKLGDAKLVGDTVYFLSGEAYGENGVYEWQAYSLKAGTGETVPMLLAAVSETDESDMKAYAEQGILEDLNPYIDAEDTMERGDFAESVLTAFETDGKLPCFSPDFSVDTMIGRSAEVGEEPGWTIEDVLALAETKPEGKKCLRKAKFSKICWH